MGFFNTNATTRTSQGLPRYLRSAYGLVLVVTASCATAGTRPHDMSAAEHEQAAQREEGSASEHEAQYDPGQWTAGGGCSTYCFDTWSNPTSHHAREAGRHRAVAAEHREASKALRKAEAEHCKNVPERDRDVSPFFHVSDIRKVERVSAGGARETYIVWFSEVPGVDAAGMQRLLDCHAARNAVLGLDSAAMDYCPLVLQGVVATAQEGDKGLRVQIEAVEADSARTLRETVVRLEARLADREAVAPARKQ